MLSEESTYFYGSDAKIFSCSKYRNNLIEQDYRLIKRVLVKSAGFQTLLTAAKILAGWRYTPII